MSSFDLVTISCRNGNGIDPIPRLFVYLSLFISWERGFHSRHKIEIMISEVSESSTVDRIFGSACQKLNGYVQL